MADLDERANAYQAALLRRERQATRELVEAYAAAHRAVPRALAAVTAEITAIQAKGGKVDAALLFQRDRLPLIQRQIEREMDRFADVAKQVITEQQRAAVRVAVEDAEQLMLAGLGEPPTGLTVQFARLPVGALEALVGVLPDGSPLRALLDELGPAASQAVRDALIEGVALGQGPRAIARRIQADLGGSLVRALLISRTSVLYSYRTASLRTYQANTDVLVGWRWHAALTTRTCAVCWAMHGRLFPLVEPFASHPVCRCAAIPWTKTWAELGFPDIPDTRLAIEPGADAFRRLSEADQLAVLGPGKFAAYRRGALDLDDLVVRTDDPRWGAGRREASLRAALSRQQQAAD